LRRGTQHEALDRKHQRQVAIKVIKPQLGRHVFW
jgi:hypothetical protein